jgi:hypothetical protein
VALDTATLIKSALDDRKYGWLKESAVVEQLWRSSTLLTKTLRETFLPGRHGSPEPPPDRRTIALWNRRYAAALRRLKQAGIETVADEQAGAELYASLRARWQSQVATLARAMGYKMNEIDPAGSEPESADRRLAFRERLRSLAP